MDPIAIGRIRTSYGLDGSVKVESYSGEVDHFRVLTRITLVKGSTRREFAVREFGMKHNMPILKLDGIETPEAAKKLGGYEIIVDRASAAPLRDGEIYLADVVGLTVMYENQPRGTVSSFYEGPQGVLLAVDTAEGAKLVPYMDIYVGEIDWEERTVELKEEWILD